jgi:hypothetical protein
VPVHAVAVREADAAAVAGVCAAVAADVVRPTAEAIVTAASASSRILRFGILFSRWLSSVSRGSLSRVACASF